MAVAPAPEKSYTRLLGDMLFSGAQAAGGAALAFYTYTNSESRIWPVAYSVVAIGGTYSVVRSIKKIFRGPAGQKSKSTPCNVITGTIISFGSLKAFSEAWNCNSKLWIPYAGVGVLGAYFASSNLQSLCASKPLLKSCPLLYQLGLILSGATYLLYFRNHKEKGLCFLACIASIQKVHEIITDVIAGYFETETEVHNLIITMIGGPVICLYACIAFKFIDSLLMLPVFLFAVGFGLFLLIRSVADLYYLVTRPVFKRYCRRVLGPVVTVYSSLAGAYIGYHMGWRFSSGMMLFGIAGIFTTYQGFKKENLPE